MMNTQLITTEFCSQLANKELGKNLTKITKAIATGNKASWQVAEGFTAIVSNELFKDDFDTEKKFASEIGISKGYLSQCKNAVLFANLHGLDKTVFTVGKCYKLSTLSEDEYKEFSDWCADNNINIATLSDKNLIEIMKSWKNGGIEEVEEVEEAEEAEEVEEVEEVEELEVEYAHITYEGKTYLIPVNVLAKYEVV